MFQDSNLWANARLLLVRLHCSEISQHQEARQRFVSFSILEVSELCQLVLKSMAPDTSVADVGSDDYVMVVNSKAVWQFY